MKSPTGALKNKLGMISDAPPGDEPFPWTTRFLHLALGMFAPALRTRPSDSDMRSAVAAEHCDATKAVSCLPETVSSPGAAEGNLNKQLCFTQSGVKVESDEILGSVCQCLEQLGFAACNHTPVFHHSRP